MFHKEGGNYGLRKMRNGMDGSDDYFGMLAGSERPKEIIRDGTEVVLHGRNQDHDTWAESQITLAKRPAAQDFSCRWLIKYLNTRWWTIPERVNLLVREQRSASDKPTNRRIEGARYHLEETAEAKLKTFVRLCVKRLKEAIGPKAKAPSTGPSADQLLRTTARVAAESPSPEEEYAKAVEEILAEHGGPRTYVRFDGQPFSASASFSEENPNDHSNHKGIWAYLTDGARPRPFDHGWGSPHVTVLQATGKVLDGRALGRVHHTVRSPGLHRVSLGKREGRTPRQPVPALQGPRVLRP